MATSDIHDEQLVDLYSMAKQYADENYVTDKQEHAIREAEAIIENRTGYILTDPYFDE